MKTKTLEKKISGHKETPYWAMWLDNAQKALTSNGEVETFIWNTYDWTILFKVSGEC